MAKRSKKPRDLNAMAASIVQETTDESSPAKPTITRNGRPGGLKGGKARAAALSADERRAIARKAAAARWAKPAQD